MVFDDSFQHEAWNDADEPRINLIVDVYHPDLSDEEIKFLSFLRSSQLRRAKAMSEAGLLPPTSDFFRVMKESREKGADDAIVFGGAATAAGAQPLLIATCKDD